MRRESDIAREASPGVTLSRPAGQRQEWHSTFVQVADHTDRGKHLNNAIG